MTILLDDEMMTNMRVSYALRWVPRASMATLLPCSVSPQAGDVALAKLEKIGKNATLELANGRRCTLHEGDLLAVVFGNRYATLQFEGYARANGDSCDLLSMGGLCGLVESKHAKAAEPSKLRLLGALGDVNCSLPKTHRATRQPPEVIQSHFGTIRTASVLPQKTKVRIANGQTARSAFSRERSQAGFDQAALRV